MVALRDMRPRSGSSPMRNCGRRARALLLCRRKEGFGFVLSSQEGCGAVASAVKWSSEVAKQRRDEVMQGRVHRRGCRAMGIAIECKREGGGARGVVTNNAVLFAAWLRQRRSVATPTMAERWAEACERGRDSWPSRGSGGSSGAERSGRGEVRLSRPFFPFSFAQLTWSGESECCHAAAAAASSTTTRVSKPEAVAKMNFAGRAAERRRGVRHWLERIRFNFLVDARAAAALLGRCRGLDCERVSGCGRSDGTGSWTCMKRNELCGSRSFLSGNSGLVFPPWPCALKASESRRGRRGKRR